MSWLTFLMSVALAMALVILFGRYAAAECLPSAQAVRDVHKAWPLWSTTIPGHHGKKCWYAEGFKTVEAHSTVPLPRANPRRTAAVAGSSADLLQSNEVAEAFALFADRLPPDPDVLERYVTVGWVLWLEGSQRRLLAFATRAQALASRW